jgi:DNA polymerase I-like protein with 3'-5' exonuclease and polymerase domains
MNYEFFSQGYIYLEDGSRILEKIDGISCSHRDFKQMCIQCMEHWSNDAKLRQAFYAKNKEYIEKKEIEA